MELKAFLRHSLSVFSLSLVTEYLGQAKNWASSGAGHTGTLLSEALREAVVKRTVCVPAALISLCSGQWHVNSPQSQNQGKPSLEAECIIPSHSESRYNNKAT